MGNDTLSAVDSMARIFARPLERASNFEAFEGSSMDACMDVCAAAMVSSLERLDRAFLGARRPVEAKTHNAQSRPFCASAGR